MLYVSLFIWLFSIISVLASDDDNCTIVREVFANSISSFTSCAISNSRPITVCEHCVDYYLGLAQSYENMSKIKNNGTLCIQNFVNLDRLEIVRTLYKNSLDLWNRAKCYECFEFVNGSLTPKPSDETTTFMSYYKTLMQCINDAGPNASSLCPTCMDNYLMLNNYYLSISNENEKIGVCMDIVDLMNNTWNFWSDKCCKYRRHNEYIFLGSTTAVVILTFLFYVLAKVSSDKKTPTIMQQRRLAESLNQLNSS